jgi:hypothetical protein
VSDALRLHVESLISTHRSVRAAAKALGIEPSYLHRLSKGEKLHPSAQTLEKLGLRRVVVYERIRPEATA